MGERPDMSWAAKRVGISVGRQNGKSQLMVARALAGVLLFGETKIVISAHQADTARESFTKLVEILEADGNGWLMDRVKPNGVMSAINRESVKFKNGATIQFKARTNAGGRGFSSDCLLLDEAQRLSQSSWVSINSTMSARPNPQVWLLGTPPTPDDDGAVFESVRDSAMSGVSTTAAWIEWGAEPEDDPADEFTRWKANPAWNTRINHEVVDGEFETYSREGFALDRLGIWASELRASRLITADEWRETETTVAPDGVRSFGVSFNIDGSRQAVAGAVKHADGVHAELVGAQTGPVEAGIASLADWLAERWRTVARIAICGQAGAGALQQALLDRGVSASVIHVMNGTEYSASCAMAYDAIRDRTLSHPVGAPGDVLDASVAVCDKKQRSRVTGAWGWSPTTADGDETPMEAFSFAHWAARTSKRVPGRKQVLL